MEPVEYKRNRLSVVSSYSEGPARKLVAVVGSHGFIELAIREGSAAKVWYAKRTDKVARIS